MPGKLEFLEFSPWSVKLLHVRDVGKQLRLAIIHCSLVLEHLLLLCLGHKRFVESLFTLREDKTSFPLCDFLQLGRWDVRSMILRLEVLADFDFGYVDYHLDHFRVL